MRQPVFEISTRYYHFDQQGVVFNMWYLAYMEDARNAYLDHVGFGLARLLASGLDIQVVACEIDWSGPVRYGDDVLVEVQTRRVGRSSLTLGYRFATPDAEVAAATSTYVVVGGVPRRAQPLPEDLRGALTDTTGPHEIVNPPSTGSSRPFR